MSRYRRKRVLFVCMGNACRSPMAEAIARVDAADAIDAFSAGLVPTGFVTASTKLTLIINGCWVEGLESKSVSPEVWEQVDIVINMSGRPKELVFRDYSKVEDWEIEDPIGKDPEIYQKVFEKIRIRVGELAQECRGENGGARIVERRAHARLCPTSLIYLDLNGANGGIAFNISENGLALSAAMILPDGPLQNLRIQFPGSQHWIQANGEIAWKSKSNKEAGIRFVSLTEEASQQLRSWIASEGSPEGRHVETNAPVVGAKGEPRERMSSLIFSETPGSASPLEAETVHEEQHPLSAGTNDKPKSSKPEYVSLGGDEEVRIQSARISTDPAASPEETENVIARPAPLEAQRRINTYQKVFEQIRRRVAKLVQECTGEVGGARIVERRAHARLCPTSMIYLDLNGANGGFAFNISENGLALSAAMILPGGPLQNLRIQFPGSQHWIQANGEIAWKSKSNKEAGIRFVGLTEEASQQLRSWIASEGSPEGRHVETSAPVVGAKGEPRERMSSLIFSETPGSASPLEAETVHEEQHPLSAGTNDKPKSSKPEYVSLGGDEEVRIQSARISTDPAASPEETENVIARPAPLEAQRLVWDWILPQVPPSDVQAQAEGISEKQDLRLEIPNPLEPRNWIHASSANGETGKEQEEVSLFSSAVGPESKNIDQKAAAQKTSKPTRKRSDKKPLWFRSRLAHGQKNPGVRRRACGAFAALISLIALIFLSLDWVARQHNVRSEGVAGASQKPKVLREAAKSATPRSVSSVPSATSPSAKKRDPQAQSIDPPVAAKAENVRDTRLKSEGQQVRAEARASAKPILKIPNVKAQSRPPERTFAPGRGTSRSLGLAAGVNSRPIEVGRPQTVSSLSPTPPQLETNIAQQAILTPPPTSDARRPEPESKASSVPAAKQPSTPANITGAVAILADPYPSLRIPNGSPKKQHQGMSLQLGHLLSRVEPVYPEDAKQQGIQGTVKLHAIIDRHGSVENLQSVNGPPILAAAAMSAVRQWRFTETLLAGKSVETEEDIDIIFRLSNPGAPRR